MIRSVLELDRSHRLVRIKQDSVRLQYDAALRGRLLERFQQVTGQLLSCRCTAQRDLPRKSPRKTCATFQNHVPNGIKAATTTPRKLPHAPFRDTLLCNGTIEIKVNDIESPLWQNQKSVISPTPSGRVHSGPRRIRADQKRHPVTITTDIRSRLSVVITVDVKEFETLLRPI